MFVDDCKKGYAIFAENMLETAQSVSESNELKDASYMPMLYKALQDAGLGEEDIEKVFYKNVLRVYKEVLK